MMGCIEYTVWLSSSQWLNDSINPKSIIILPEIDHRTIMKYMYLLYFLHILKYTEWNNSDNQTFTFFH